MRLIYLTAAEEDHLVRVHRSKPIKDEVTGLVSSGMQTISKEAALVLIEAWVTPVGDEILPVEIWVRKDTNSLFREF